MLSVVIQDYEVLIQGGLLDQLGPLVLEVGPFSSALVVTDEQVGPLYAERAMNSLTGVGLPTHLVMLPAGEGQKRLERVAELYDLAVATGLDRHGVVVALGGGVIGDLAGFFAATYLRGVAWVAVPTTLLAMVDASIGGKTGVNLPEGKNLVGAFHRPRRVVVDPGLLQTLPPRQTAAGLAEVVKHGLIGAPDLLDQLASGITPHLLARNAAVKGRVVVADEFERRGGRAALNLGHTVAHAVEQVAGYGPWLHGEAVSVGLVAACRLAEVTQVLEEPLLPERVATLLTKLGLPVRLAGLPLEALLAALGRDKKRAFGELGWVLPVRAGLVRTGCRVSEEQLRAVLSELGAEAGVD